MKTREFLALKIDLLLEVLREHRKEAESTVRNQEDLVDRAFWRGMYAALEETIRLMNHPERITQRAEALGLLVKGPNKFNVGDRVRLVDDTNGLIVSPRRENVRGVSNTPCRDLKGEEFTVTHVQRNTIDNSTSYYLDNVYFTAFEDDLELCEEDGHEH